MIGRVCGCGNVFLQLLLTYTAICVALFTALNLYLEISALNTGLLIGLDTCDRNNWYLSIAFIKYFCVFLNVFHVLR